MRSLSFTSAKKLISYNLNIIIIIIEIDKLRFCFQSCPRTMLDYEILFTAHESSVYGSYPGNRSQPEPGDRVGAQAEAGDEYLVKPDLPSWVGNVS